MKNEKFGEIVISEEESYINDDVMLTATKASMIQVKDKASYEAAARFLKDIKRQEDAVLAFIDPILKKAREAYEIVLSRKKEMIDPLESAKKIVKKAISEYEVEEDRKRAEYEEQVKMAAEAERIIAIQRVEEAKNSGNEYDVRVASEQAKLLEFAVKNAVVEVEPVKAKGVSTSKDWEIVSIDSSLVPISFEGAELRPVKDSAIMKLIRSKKGKVEIPGVAFKEIKKVSVR